MCFFLSVCEIFTTDCSIDKFGTFLLTENDCLEQNNQAHLTSIKFGASLINQFQLASTDENNIFHAKF